MFYRYDTKEVLNSVYELRQAFPRVSFGTEITPEALTGLPVKILETKPMPEYDFYTQRVELTEPVLDSAKDIYVREYTVIALTAEEKTARLEELRTQKYVEIANNRYAVECGGVDFGGSIIKTDRESQATINGAVTAVTRDATRIIDWKADNNQWIQLDKNAILAIADAVTNHVQTCFSREKEISEEISLADTVAELQAIKWTM